MTTRSSGFTLIELLVVVAIIGILSAIGVTSYSGYVNGAKVKTAENILYQVALGQTEFYTDNRIYKVDSNVNCPADADTSSEIETTLFGGSRVITETVAGGRASKIDFNFCIDDTGDYKISATATSASSLNCTITLNSNNEIDKTACQ